MESIEAAEVWILHTERSKEHTWTSSTSSTLSRLRFFQSHCRHRNVALCIVRPPGKWFLKRNSIFVKWSRNCFCQMIYSVLHSFPLLTYLLVRTKTWFTRVDLENLCTWFLERPPFSFISTLKSGKYLPMLSDNNPSHGQRVHQRLLGPWNFRNTAVQVAWGWWNPSLEILASHTRCRIFTHSLELTLRSC